MHAHAEAEGQASGPPSESTPSSAAERRGQAQKSTAAPAAQTPKFTGRKSKGWQYTVGTASAYWIELQPAKAACMRTMWLWHCTAYDVQALL